MEPIDKIIVEVRLAERVAFENGIQQGLMWLCSLYALDETTVTKKYLMSKIKEYIDVLKREIEDE